MPTTPRMHPLHPAAAAGCGAALLLALASAVPPVSAQDPAEPEPAAAAAAEALQAEDLAAPQPPRYAPAATGEAASFSLLSPFRSLARSRQLLDTAALRLALELDYREESDGERQRKLAGMAGVKAARFFSRSVGGQTRSLELALAAYPTGGYQLYVDGSESDGTARRPNPELAAAEATLRRLLEELTRTRGQAAAAKFGDRNNHYLSYQLSYVQSDRAVALLKVFGYSVIEFQAAGGQPLGYDKIFDANPPPGDLTLPVVIRLIDSDKTSLLEPSSGGGGRGGGGGGQAISLGGLFLDRITAGVPQQRLLIAYDGDDPEPMQVLVNLLRDHIDVPARQILIEALVIELNQDRLSDLGIDFEANKDGSSLSFLTDSFIQPLTYVFQQPSAKTLLELNVTFKALVSRGHARVLSRPSVLVLDGRQARIQVGEKIPYTKNIAATNTGTLSSTDYLTTGIVLNLRPRISRDGTQITMQVETLISSAGPSGFVAGVLVAPPIQSREVQTLVRVANNTPFVIGGLIATDEQTDVTGVPGLSKVPLLGALFRKKTRSRDAREVIVVITPHVVPLHDRTFSYAIPDDSEIFDSFDKELFRNVYRIRPRDVYDLSFVYDSQVLRDLVARLRSDAELDPSLAAEEPFRSVLAGGVPGEEILVRRMLWEVVRAQGFTQHVLPKNIFYFEQSGDASGLDVTLLEPEAEARDRSRDALVLSFEGMATSVDRPFDPPRGTVSYEPLNEERFFERLRQGNRKRPDGSYERNTLVLSDAYPTSSSPEEVLRGVLVLKRLLELNSELPLTLDGFHVGLEIVFPSIDDLRQRLHLVDRRAARLFYEVTDYYRAFEEEFSAETRRIRELLDGGAIRPAEGSSGATR